jgi:SPOR domain
MGVPRIRPAPQVNPEEFERRLREGVQRTSPNDPLSKLAPKTDSSRLPPPGPSRCVPTVTGHTRSYAESSQLFDFGDVRPSDETHDDETSIVDAQDPRALDVDDFRRWWQQGLAQEAAENRSRGWKLTPMALVLAGIAITGSIFALKGGAPGVLNGPPIVPSANDTARTQTPSGETTSTPADVSTMPSTELATAVAPKVVAPLASRALVQTTDTKPARAVSVRADGTLIATQLPSAAEPNEASSSPDVPKPPAKSAPEGTDSAVATARPSTDLPTKRPGKITTRVVVATTGAAAPIAAADTPIPPLSIGTPVKPDEAGGAKDLQPITESVAAPATPAEAAKQSLNPLVRALADLFGARPSRARQGVDPTPTASTGWAVQLATSRTEAEAKSDLKRLNAKYASALNRSTIRLHKARVDGETVYRLRIVGLSKADAAALCERLKGDGGSCFIVRW